MSFFKWSPKMTIQSAIIAAKSSYNWSIVPHEPTTVSVRYRMKGGTLLETDFDLYTDNPETELEYLWERLCGELCSARDAVQSVKAYGYILE